MTLLGYICLSWFRTWLCKYQIKNRYKVFNSLSLSNHCAQMNRCPCSECWDLDIPGQFLDDWMLQLMFYALGMCHHFKTQEILGQEQLKFIVVSEIELNVLKIKRCSVPMGSRYFAKEECHLSWSTISLPVKPMGKKKVNIEYYSCITLWNITFLKCIKTSESYSNYLYKSLKYNGTAQSRDFTNILSASEQKNRAKLHFSWTKLIAKCFTGMYRITFTNLLHLTFGRIRI